MNMRILLASVFALAIPESVHCEEEDDTELDEESVNEGQLRSLHGLIDADKDGKVSLPETLTFARTVARQVGLKDVSTILEEIDTSKDGKLSLEEHLSDIKAQSDGSDEAEQKEVNHRVEVETAKFKVADSNGDQLLDLEELTSLFYPETHDGVLGVTVQETMRQKDKNGDGKLTPEEFWEVEPSDGEDGRLSEEELTDFKKLDTNGDGALELSEVRPWESGAHHIEDAMKQLLETADKDSDMHVTADELANARSDVSMDHLAHPHLLGWIDHHEL